MAVGTQRGHLRLGHGTFLQRVDFAVAVGAGDPVDVVHAPGMSLRNVLMAAGTRNLTDFDLSVDVPHQVVDFHVAAGT